MQSMSWRARLPEPIDIPADRVVYDGDTCFLTRDRGGWDRTVTKCRLKDVYAPERHPPQTGWAESRQFLADWIAYWNNPKLRWPFWIDTFKDGADNDVMSFDRYVTDIWNADRTAKLNTEIQAFITRNGYPGGVGS